MRPLSAYADWKRRDDRYMKGDPQDSLQTAPFVAGNVSAYSEAEVGDEEHSSNALEAGHWTSSRHCVIDAATDSPAVVTPDL